MHECMYVYLELSSTHWFFLQMPKLSRVRLEFLLDLPHRCQGRSYWDIIHCFHKQEAGVQVEWLELKLML